MYSCIKTCVLQGLEGFVVDVECDLSRGLPKFSIVGLADLSIRESSERVRAAIKNSGFEFPLSRITINLAPANLKKEGSQMDLGIAISILSANNEIQNERLNEFIFLGELSLDGQVNEINGTLPMIIAMREMGYKKFIIPEKNKEEGTVVKDVEVYPVNSLEEVVSFLKGEKNIERAIGTEFNASLSCENSLDFADIKGQENLKRALEVAAAGGHNILIIGSPGSGKTMAAKRVPGILPSLSFNEAIEVTKIYSVAGLLESKELMKTRPFRDPHHTASAVSLIGGGRIPKPGEISLSHNGILFLDELLEFPRSVLEVLRQPLEDNQINISRASGSLTYPSRFLLIASMNPCPCGFFGHPVKECTCTMQSINKYLSKISHPLLDRIDIHIEVMPVNYEDIRQEKVEESSSDIKKRVEAARNIQLERFKDKNIYSNSEIGDRDLNKYCKLDSNCEKLMELAFKKYNFSGRSHNKLLKVARTIADLENSKDIRESHLLEAIRYRSLDSKYWSN